MTSSTTRLNGCVTPRSRYTAPKMGETSRRTRETVTTSNNYLDDAELRRLLHQGHVQRAWIKKEPDKSFCNPSRSRSTKDSSILGSAGCKRMDSDARGWTRIANGSRYALVIPEGSQHKFTSLGSWKASDMLKMPEPRW